MNRIEEQAIEAVEKLRVAASAIERDACTRSFIVRIANLVQDALQRAGDEQAKDIIDPSGGST
ncbi:MAG: hypothetical protein FJ271_28480 [Planctomycetes bacterium]|nr:hypothetical protein [Planctomycetota bacterium]